MDFKQQLLTEERVYTRTFTRADILQFAEISGDRGEQHVAPNQKVMAHGLLLATLPTRLGGELNFIAAEMHFNFIKPAYEGDTLTCLARAVTVVERPLRYKVRFEFNCSNHDGIQIFTGSSSGYILKER